LLSRFPDIAEDVLESLGDKAVCTLQESICSKSSCIDEVIKFLEKLLVYKEKLGVFDEYETQSWNFRHQTRRPGICKSMSCVCHNKSYLILLNFRIFKYYIHNIYLVFFFNLQN
jgi:hypothetical protein